MYLAIDYGDEPVEVVETSSRQIDHLIPESHKARVSTVSSLISAALKRRKFFTGLTRLSSTELLSTENPCHQEYLQHLNDLANIPYDGYHTEYSLWDAKFAESSLGSDLQSPSVTGFSGILEYITSQNLPGRPSDTKDEQLSQAEPLQIGFVKHPDDETPGETGGQHDRGDSEPFDK
ncbi:MAG TPA: hypothetical protein VF682_20865 [Pseudomonas sp.]|jgi:hypothetical protein